MLTQTAPPQLGNQVLIVIDEDPRFFEALHSAVLRLSDLAHVFFTLICCCPTHYWGHPGDDTPELKRYIDELHTEEEGEFDHAGSCLKYGEAILREAGATPDHILAKISTEDTLMNATVTELRNGRYSSVIISSRHYDVVNRLQGQGITDIFRHLPEVEVWAIDSEKRTSYAASYPEEDS
jgi:hypothetical protein